MSTDNICFIEKYSCGQSYSSGAMKNTFNTVITLSIGTPYLLTILVLKFEIVHSTTS